MKITLGQAQECADRYIEAEQMCAGCPADHVCGIGEYSRGRLGEFLRAVDPSGLNIKVFELRPIGSD